MSNTPQNSSGQQTFRFLLLFLAAFFLMRSFFNGGKNPNPAPPRTAPTLELAFKGVDPNQKPRLDKTAAQTEITDLATQIGGLEMKPQRGFWANLLSPQQSDPKESDEYSYWARFRVGLLRQYLLKDAAGATQMYNEVVNNNSGTASANRIKAQAIYQKGDLLWHTAKGDYGTRQEAATTLEQLVHKGRGSSAFLDMNILVPQPAPSSTQNSADAVLDPQSFAPVKVRELRGTATAHNLEGLPDRVDLYYAPTTFHKAFDFMANLFGKNPQISYGLAILFFAIALRLCLQPINKRQYASAKGMQEIAPQMKKIQDKYKDKPDQQMQAMKEIRELQKTHGVNPMSALGWGLAQMPIFFFLVYPLIQHYEAKLELTGASFLWIHSLARADYPLLAAYALSQFLSFRLSATPPADKQQAQMQGIMSILMPLTIPFFLKDYPAAFTLFWMTFNVVSTFFQYRMVKAADPTHNFVTALMRSPFTATVEESLPPRPTDDAKTERKETPKNAFDSTRSSGTRSSDKNGSSNGARNGKSPEVLSKITPFDLEQSNSSSTSSTGSSSATKTTVSRAAQRKRRRRH